MVSEESPKLTKLPALPLSEPMVWLAFRFRLVPGESTTADALGMDEVPDASSVPASTWVGPE